MSDNPLNELRQFHYYEALRTTPVGEFVAPEIPEIGGWLADIVEAAYIPPGGFHAARTGNYAPQATVPIEIRVFQKRSIPWANGSKEGVRRGYVRVR